MMELHPQPSPVRPDDMSTPTMAHFEPSISQFAHQRSRQATPADPTPTRDSFSLAEKRPLSPQESSTTMRLAPPDTQGDLSRQESLQSLKSNDTHASSNTGAGDDPAEGSDQEDAGDTYPPQKKKRSQRFYCRDYPPCALSFTRSEHLARHIRKHTGERPFACHCQRRFSRLDNLRQHAQTVHLNEDIPVDSLAATGTRFQRQVRTERMKTPGHRQRASTMSSSGSHSRGHSRNISGSSIGSMSEFGATPGDGRRRHPPLAMAQPNTPRPGLSVDTYSPTAPPPYYNYSPSGYSTPMSVYSGEATSPRMSSALGSPISMMPRSAIGWGGQNSSRRLSVPTGVNPYQNHFVAPQPPFMSPIMNSSTPYYANVGGAHVSPPREAGQHSRHQSLDVMEAEWRRRTWHPSTRHSIGSRPATSGLSYHQRPDDPQSVPTTQPAAQQAVRLPGIDSFDRSSIHSGGSSRRPGDSMDVDAVSAAGETEGSSKRNSWNSMNQNMNQLELLQNTPPRDGAVLRRSIGSQQQAFAHPSAMSHAQSTTHSQQGSFSSQPNINLVIDPALQQPHTPRASLRKAPDLGDLPTSFPVGEPGPAVRTSPDGSANSEEVHTPSSAVDYRPAIIHSDGRIERQSVAGVEEHQKVSPTVMPPRGHDTQRLDALVAVATSEEQAISHH